MPPAFQLLVSLTVHLLNFIFSEVLISCGMSYRMHYIYLGKDLPHMLGLQKWLILFTDEVAWV